MTTTLEWECRRSMMLGAPKGFAPRRKERSFGSFVNTEEEHKAQKIVREAGSVYYTESLLLRFWDGVKEADGIQARLVIGHECNGVPTVHVLLLI